jgi:hypothetical protein
MLVSPTGLNNNGFGGFGGDGWWIILLFILLGNNGWGNGFGGYGGGEFPWLYNGQQNINANTNAGFRDAMLNDSINGVRDGVTGLATQLCNSTSAVQMALANGFAGVEAGANARQIADMQTAFAGQTAMAQGFNGLQSQLAQCCCDNRLATCQTQNIVQNEGNATRFADANNTRDIIDSQTRGTQAILDKLCALELDAKNDTIAQLRSELMYARGQASQDVQTAAIQAGQRALANEVEQYVLPTPRPAYIVTNPNCCTNACGCGV